MRKDILTKKVMCSVLALGMLSAADTALANSGGELRMWIKDVPIVGTRVMHDYIGVLTDGCNNLVTIDDGTENGKAINYVYGTYIDKSEYTEAYNNRVIVEAGKIINNRNFGDGLVYGAYLENGRAESNSVLVNGGNVEGFVYGAWVNTGTADNNKVILDGGIIGDEAEDAGGEIYGARVEDGSARNNIIVIKSGSVFADSIGAYVSSGYATDNIAIINDGLSNCVQGAVVENGTAEANMAVMNGGTVNLGIRGGYSHTVSNNNVVLVNDGYIGNSGGAFVIKDGAIGGFVDLSTGGIANYNSINVTGGTINNTGVYGGYIIENDADTGNIADNGAKTIGNSVGISGGNINGNVYGGCIEGGGTVENNSIVISGGTVEGEVYGGYLTGNGTVSNNAITISGTADVSKAMLYGGAAAPAGNGTVSDNKLIINGWSGEVNSLNNFSNMDFENIGTETAIKVNDEQNTNVTNTVINIKSVARDEKIQVGNELKITFTGLGVDDFAAVKISEDGILQGVATAIKGDLNVDSNTITVDVTSIAAHSQTAITTESRAAAAAFVNQGAEAVSDSINSLQGAEAGVSAFATVSGNNSKYDTGSYVDINGWNGIVGVANTKDLDAGKFSYGAFFENGSGNYNTYNEFNGASFRGDGDVVYNGGGVLLRYEQDSGVYTEASLRAGTAKNEVSNVLADGSGNLHGYKTENAYYGAHIGIGKIFKLDNGKAWDIYGKYFHTHHEGDSVKIANDVFDFDSVDSDKLRIGARFSEQQGAKLASYYGLAWEYEFSGDAGGTANHHAMYTPSLEGSTVIGEVGFRYTPGKASPWYFDANIKGYVGMQEGISGSVQAVYSF